MCLQAAEAVRLSKEQLQKNLDEHGKQVSILLTNSNKIVTEQERLAASTPRYVIPSLLKSAGINLAEFAESSTPTSTARPQSRNSSRAPGPSAGAAVAGPSGVSFAASTDLESLRKEYAESVSRLKVGHEQELGEMKSKLEMEISRLEHTIKDLVRASV